MRETMKFVIFEDGKEERFVFANGFYFHENNCLALWVAKNGELKQEKMFYKEIKNIDNEFFIVYI